MSNVQPLEIQQLVIEKIKNYPGLVPDVFADVLNRPPQEGTSKVANATPTVYQGAFLQNTVWVREGGLYHAPWGEGFGGKMSTPSVIGITRATTTGKQAMSVLGDAIQDLFGKAYYTMSNGSVWEYRIGNRLPQVEGSEEGYNGMVMSTWTLEVVGIHQLVVRY